MVRLILLALAAPVWSARVNDGFANLEDVNLHGDVDGVLLETEHTPVSILDPRHMPAQNLMSYGWVPDWSSPNFLRIGRRLFDFEEDDIQLTNQPSALTQFIQEESLEETSSRISADMGLSGRYGCFSASVSASVTSGSHQSLRQMMAIYRSRTVNAVVVNNVLYPKSRLRPQVQQFIQEMPAQLLIDRLGQFYATQMTLGGVIRTKFQQTRTQSDSYSDFAAHVSARYNTLAARAQASAGFTSGGSATGSSESLHVEIQIQGGDETIMLRGGDWVGMQADWSDTVGDHLYPVSFRLLPLWEVIKEVNQTKGEEVERLLRSQWNDDRLALALLDQLPDVQTMTTTTAPQAPCHKLITTQWLYDELEHPDVPRASFMHSSSDDECIARCSRYPQCTAWLRQHEWHSLRPGQHRHPLNTEGFCMLMQRCN